MKDLSLHILDLVQNSIAAKAKLIKITINEDKKNDLLTITIEDDGKGMDKDFVEAVKNPFVTTRTTRKVGLGIPLMIASCERSGGHLNIESELNVGTIIIANFRYYHIDRAPIGDMTQTMVSLILCNDSIDYIYKHTIDDREFLLDTRKLRDVLGEDLLLSDPQVLSWIKEFINEGLKSIMGV